MYSPYIARQLTIPSTYVLKSDCITNTGQEAQKNNSRWIFQAFHIALHHIMETLNI